MSRPAPRGDRSVLLDSASVGLATGVYGISFGALSVASGLSTWQTCVISLLVFTGASQFAFVGILSAGGSSVAAVSAAVLLSSRNAFYAISIARILSLNRWRRFLAAQLVIDESTAMAVAQPNDRQARLGFYATGLIVFICWNTSTLVGALAGSAIGDPRDIGLDAAVGAAFLALLWPRLSTVLSRGVALSAGLMALLLAPFTPVGVPIIVAGLAAVLLGLAWSRTPNRADDVLNDSASSNE